MISRRVEGKPEEVAEASHNIQEQQAQLMEIRQEEEEGEPPGAGHNIQKQHRKDSEGGLSLLQSSKARTWASLLY